MNHNKSAFTLIELMLVIAIMAILATVLVSSIHSVKRQAQSTLCQTRMRNLHQGVMNYFAENEAYPFAGSHEFRNDYFSPPRYKLNVGWIAWIHGDQEIDEEDKKDSTKSKASFYKYVGCGIDDGDTAVKRSISNGALFPYVKRDYSTYFCKQFNSGKLDLRHQRYYRTFAMNKFFGSRTNPREYGIRAQDLRYYDKKKKDYIAIEASRLALFVELADTTGAKGTQGHSGTWGEGAKNTLPDDASWDWNRENYGCWHKKGKDYFGHVIFLDGHVESLLKNQNIREKSEMIGTGSIKN